ncbi:MAG: class II aldolase/adducin family protein [Myxococcales bacterium]
MARTALPDERALRAQLVEAGRRLRERGLIGGGEGNLSARLGPGHLLCTPAGVNKGFLRPADLVVTDLAGAPRDPRRRASSELLLHLACYQERPDCRAVVHAHPPHAVALTLSGESLLACMPEAVTALGEVPTAPFALPGGPDLARAARQRLATARCLLLERHGALALGLAGDASPLLAACDRMEMLEGVARVQLLAGLRGRPTALPAAVVRALSGPAPKRTSPQE